MRYELDQNNAVKIFEDAQDVPFAYQPQWPNGTKWADVDEAKDWAETLIESKLNPESQYVPGNSPENHPALRPESMQFDENGFPVYPEPVQPEA